MKTEPTKRGGTRAGAGRPPLGKTRVNLTLNSEMVERTRKREKNLSSLIDSLLSRWLDEKN